MVVVGALAVGACGGSSRATTAAKSRTAASTTTTLTVAAVPMSVASTTTTARVAARPVALLAGVRGRTIVIDPGHNGQNYAHTAEINRLVDAVTLKKPCDTTGTETDNGYTESAFNLDVARRLSAILQAAGATVVLTRSDDNGWGPCIDERAAIGNNAHAAVAVSIHADGGPASGRGFEVIEPALIPGHTDAIVGPSRLLGTDIRDAFRRDTGIPYATYIGTDGIDVRNDLGGLNLSTVPKVFIECANMRNAVDAAQLVDPAFRQRAAQGIADGISAFLSH